MLKLKVPHKLITKELLFEWGHIVCGDYLLNWNGIYLIEKGNKWDYGSPEYYTIDDKHPFIKYGEVEYLDELNCRQFIKYGRGLNHHNEQKRREYYIKNGINYSTFWQRIKLFISKLHA